MNESLTDFSIACFWPATQRYDGKRLPRLSGIGSCFFPGGDFESKQPFTGYLSVDRQDKGVAPPPRSSAALSCRSRNPWNAVGMAFADVPKSGGGGAGTGPVPVRPLPPRQGFPESRSDGQIRSWGRASSPREAGPKATAEPRRNGQAVWEVARKDTRVRKGYRV